MTWFIWFRLLLKWLPCNTSRWTVLNFKEDYCLPWMWSKTFHKLPEPLIYHIFINTKQITRNKCQILAKIKLFSCKSFVKLCALPTFLQSRFVFCFVRRFLSVVVFQFNTVPWFPVPPYSYQLMQWLLVADVCNCLIISRSLSVQGTGFLFPRDAIS